MRLHQRFPIRAYGTPDFDALREAVTVTGDMAATRMGMALFDGDESRAHHSAMHGIGRSQVTMSSRSGTRQQFSLTGFNSQETIIVTVR